MVFEQLVKATWVEGKLNAFLLGLIYTIVGILSAAYVFPSNAGLMSIAFTSVLLIPSLSTLLSLEEHIESKGGKFSLRRLFKDHKDIFQAYIFLFLGIFLAYSMASLILPQMAVEKLFAVQLKAAGITGHAFLASQFSSIVLNNLLVFAVALILSLIYGAGAVVFLVWNSAVWGVVFGYIARQAAAASGNDPVVAFAQSMGPYLPHMIAEALAYVFAAIVGGIVSKAILREKPWTKPFKKILVDAAILCGLGIVVVVVAGVIEVFAFS